MQKWERGGQGIERWEWGAGQRGGSGVVGGWWRPKKQQAKGGVRGREGRKAGNVKGGRAGGGGNERKVLLVHTPLQPTRGTFILLQRAVDRAVKDLWRIHHQRWWIACFGHCLRSPGGREGQTQKSCKLEPTIRSAHSQNSMLSLTSKFC